MIRFSVFFLILFFWLGVSNAQQTIFNVPSADVLEPRSYYIENDWYARTWDTPNGQYGTTYIRGVMGIGHNVELGLNLGAFDLVNQNNPFVDVAGKWRIWMIQDFGFYVGNHVGIGVGGPDAGKTRDFVYGAFMVKIPTVETRICAGPYFATQRVFDSNSRGGGLVTFEQPLKFVPGLVLAADWFSGDGAYFTPGLIFSQNPFTFYLGYGLANTGRLDDQVTTEVGFSF